MLAVELAKHSESFSPRHHTLPAEEEENDETDDEDPEQGRLVIITQAQEKKTQEKVGQENLNQL